MKLYPKKLSLSWPRFVVIGGGWRLGLLASELSADGFCNPQNARVKRLTGARSVVIGRTRPVSFLFHRHSDAPSSGPSDEKQRGSSERKSESRAVVAERKDTCCRRFLFVGCQYPKPFRAAVARRPMLIPRIPRQDGGAFRSSLNLTCSASPCRAGDIRSRPQAAKRGRGTRQP